MKTIVTLSIAFFYLNQLNAQSTFQILYGNTQGYSSAGAANAQQTVDGGYIITGHTDNYPPASGDLFLLKTDTLGTAKWFKTYVVSVGPDPKVTTVRALEKTADGGYIVAGSAYGIQSNADVLVIKTDGNGNVQWHKIYAGYGKSEALAIKQTATGQFIIVGTANDLGAISQYSTGLYALKLSATGDSIWTKTYNYDDESQVIPANVKILSDGNFLIGGTGYPANPWPGDGLPVLIKINAANGNIIWSKSYGTLQGYPLSESMTDFDLATDGSYIIAGTTLNYTKQDGLLMKIDASGNNILWTKSYTTADSTNSDHIHSLAITANGDYALYGDVFFGANSQHYNFFMRTDNSGALSFAKLVGNGLNNYGSSILATHDKGFLLSGFEIADFNFDGTTAYVIKADSNGVSGCYESPVDITVNSQNFQVQSGPIAFDGGGNLSNETVTVSDEFLPVTVLCQNPPPQLLFTTFSGKNQINKNTLKWKTKSELKSDRYYIQKGSDKTNITTIGKVNASYKTLSDTPYKFTDNKQITGTHYYRIKAVHKNGEITYSKFMSLTNNSNIIAVNNTNVPGMILFKSDEAYNAPIISYSIYNTIGYKVYDGRIQNSFGKINATANLSFLQNGIYLVNFNTADNGTRQEIIITH